MPETACLHIQARDSDPIRVVELPGTSVRIGRASYCEVRLSEPDLADEECRLKRRGGVWQLVPSRASSFVWLDGHAVASTCALPFDVPFRVGEHWLTLRPTGTATPEWRAYKTPAPSASNITREEHRPPVTPPTPRVRDESPDLFDFTPAALRPSASPSPDYTQPSRWKARDENRAKRTDVTPEERRWENRWRAAGERVRARPSIKATPMASPPLATPPVATPPQISTPPITPSAAMPIAPKDDVALRRATYIPSELKDRSRRVIAPEVPPIPAPPTDLTPPLIKGVPHSNTAYHAPAIPRVDLPPFENRVDSRPTIDTTSESAPTPSNTESAHQTPLNSFVEEFGPTSDTSPSAPVLTPFTSDSPSSLLLSPEFAPGESPAAEELSNAPESTAEEVAPAVESRLETLEVEPISDASESTATAQSEVESRLETLEVEPISDASESTATAQSEVESRLETTEVEPISDEPAWTEEVHPTVVEQVEATEAEPSLVDQTLDETRTHDEANSISEFRLGTGIEPEILSGDDFYPEEMLLLIDGEATSSSADLAPTLDRGHFDGESQTAPEVIVNDDFLVSEDILIDPLGVAEVDLEPPSVDRRNERLDPVSFAPEPDSLIVDSVPNTTDQSGTSTWSQPLESPSPVATSGPVIGARPSVVDDGLMSRAIPTGSPPLESARVPVDLTTSVHDACGVSRPTSARTRPTPVEPGPSSSPPEGAEIQTTWPRLESASPIDSSRWSTSDEKLSNPEPPPSGRDWPSAQHILASHQASIRRATSARPKSSVSLAQPQLTELKEPAHWAVPLWLGWPLALLAVLGLGTLCLVLSCLWSIDTRWSGVVANSLVNGRGQVKALADTIPTPDRSWWKSTSANLMLWSLYYDRRAAVDPLPVNVERATELLETASQASPMQSLVRFAMARRTAAENASPGSLLTASLGLSRDIEAQAWLGRQLLKSGKKEAALKAYRAALEMAARTDLTRVEPLDFDDDNQVQRYHLPGEALAGRVVRDMAEQTEWTFSEWKDALPSFAPIPLTAARLFRERGSADTDAALDLILSRLDAPAPDGTSHPLHRVAQAEAFALKSRWKEAESLYREALEEMPIDSIKRSWWLNLAEIDRRLNDESGRQIALGLARGTNANDEIAQRAIDLLKITGSNLDKSRARVQR